jgi:hypothetical protein
VCIYFKIPLGAKNATSSIFERMDDLTTSTQSSPRFNSEIVSCTPLVSNPERLSPDYHLNGQAGERIAPFLDTFRNYNCT